MSLTPAADDSNKAAEAKRMKSDPESYDGNALLRLSERGKAIPYPQSGGLVTEPTKSKK